MWLIFQLISLFSFFSSVWANNCSVEFSEQFVWTLVHTSQIRGHVMPATLAGVSCSVADTLATNNQCLGGAARRQTMFDEFRATSPNPIFVDTGGYFWGTLFFNEFGEAGSVRYFNTAEYDVYGIEQADFFDTTQTLSKWLRAINSTAQVISSNMNITADPFLGVPNPMDDKPFISPYAVVRRSGVNIGFVCLVDPSLPDVSAAGQYVTVLPASQLVSSVQLAVNSLKELDVQIVVLISNVFVASAIDDVVNAVPDVDVVIENFDRTSTAPSASNLEDPYPRFIFSGDRQVPVVSSGEYGQYVGKLVLRFDPFSGDLCSCTGDAYVVDNTTAFEQPLWDYSQQQQAEVEQLGATVVGSTLNYVDGTRGDTTTYLGIRFSDMPMSRLVLDATLASCPQCDFAILNAGSIRGSLAVGNISYSELYTVLAFGNSVSIFIIKGIYIVQALIAGISGGPGGGGFAQVAGLRYAYNPNPTIDPTLRILEVEIWDKTKNAYVPVVLTQYYRVVTNNYLRTGGDGYDVFEHYGTSVLDYGPDVMAVVISYLKTHNPLNEVTTAQLAHCNGANQPYFASPRGDCRIVQTVGSAQKDLINTCPTDLSFCENQFAPFADITYRNASCDSCTGLGKCEQQVCTCDVPTDGLFEGIDMYGGDDCATFRTVFSLSSSWRSFLISLSVISMLGSLVLFVWVYLNRPHPVIKASSPIFGGFISVGSFLCPISVLVDLEQPNEISCNANLWLLVTGYVLVYVSLFAKTYRLHRIFNNKRLVESRWTQSRLLRIMAVLALGDFVILFVLAVVDPLRPKGFIDDSAAYGAVVECTSNKIILYYFLIFLYNGALLVWGVYVTLQVRNINLAAFNESKPLALSIYNLTFVSVACMPLLFVFSAQPQFFLIFKNFLVLYVTMFTQLAIYFPKYITMRDKSNPQNDPRFWNKGLGQDKNNPLAERLLVQSSDFDSVDISRANQVLLERVTELEDIIKEKDRIIEELQARLDDRTVSQMNNSRGGGSASGTPLGNNSRTSLEVDSVRSNSRKTTAYAVV